MVVPKVTSVTIQLGVLGPWTLTPNKSARSHPPSKRHLIENWFKLTGLLRKPPRTDRTGWARGLIID